MSVPKYVFTVLLLNSLIADGLFVHSSGITPVNVREIRRAWDTIPAPDELPSVVLARLTVRPHEMATGTQNRHAGLQPLDSLKNYSVYVPANCVGRKRVPLVVALGGAGESAQRVFERQRPFADKYGMILLLPEAAGGNGLWDVLPATSIGSHTRFVPDPNSWPARVMTFSNPDVRNIDAALKQVLRTFAIDPDKIAVTGFSNGGSYSLFLGRHNTHVFSRIAPLSAVYPMGGAGPVTPTTQYFLSGGITEDMVPTVVAISWQLQQQGHRVHTVLGLRGHSNYTVDLQYMWTWLHDSWSTPQPSSHRDLQPPPDADPILTVDALDKMTRFWTRFMQLPREIRMTARMAHQKPVTVFLGKLPIVVMKADMIALAAKYPQIAEALSAAGLTAEQEEQYRIAIIRVGFTRTAIREPGPMTYGRRVHGAMLRAQITQDAIGPISPASVLGRNMAFRAEQDRAFAALVKTQMWTTQ